MSGKQPAAMNNHDDEDAQAQAQAANSLLNLQAGPAPSKALTPDQLRERLTHFYEGRSMMGYDLRDKGTPAVHAARIAANPKYHTAKGQAELFAKIERKYPPKVEKPKMYQGVPGDTSGKHHGAMAGWLATDMMGVFENYPEKFAERLAELQQMAADEKESEMLSLSTAAFTAKSCKQQIDQATAELRATQEVNEKIAQDPRFSNPEYVKALGAATQLMQQELIAGKKVTLPGGIELQMNPEQIRQMMEAGVRQQVEGAPGTIRHFNVMIRNLVNGVMANLKATTAGNAANLIERTMAAVNPIIQQYIPPGSRREWYAQYALTYALWYAQNYLFRLVASTGCWMFFGSGMGGPPPPGGMGGFSATGTAGSGFGVQGGKRKSRRHRAHKKRKSRKGHKSRKGRRSPKRKVKRGKTHKRKARKGRKSHKRKH